MTKISYFCTIGYRTKSLLFTHKHHCNAVEGSAYTCTAAILHFRVYRSLAPALPRYAPTHLAVYRGSALPKKEIYCSCIC